MTKTSLCVCAALLLFAVPAVQAGAAPRDLAATLNETVPAYTVDERSFPTALMAFSSSFHVPMGIEWIEPAQPRRVAHSWKRSTVRQILESIVKSEPGYQLQVGNNIVNVFYMGALTDKTNFLNIRLPDFRVRNEYVAMALVQLHLAVRPRVLMSPPETGWAGHVMLDPHDRRVNLDFKHASVRHILDSLTVLGGRKVWIVTFRRGAGLTKGGFRRATTIWNSHPISDEYQPVWDRYEWGTPLSPYAAPAGSIRFHPHPIQRGAGLDDRADLEQVATVSTFLTVGSSWVKRPTDKRASSAATNQNPCRPEGRRYKTRGLKLALKKERR